MYLLVLVFRLFFLFALFFGAKKEGVQTVASRIKHEKTFT